MRDKRERFVSLAEARTDKAIKAVRSLANLSNRANYEYTDDDVQQIVRALDHELKALRLKFQQSGGSGGNTFKLKQRG